MKESDMAYSEELVFRPLPQLVIEANVNPQEFATAQASAKADNLGILGGRGPGAGLVPQMGQAILDDSEAPRYRWFKGAQCNIVYNALDRHIATRPTRTSWRSFGRARPGTPRKYTYYELYREVNKLANAMRSLGPCARGDRVVLYMPLIPADHDGHAGLRQDRGPCTARSSPDFQPRLCASASPEVEAKLVVTADGFYRNGRIINLKTTVDEALVSRMRLRGDRGRGQPRQARCGHERGTRHLV